MDSSSSRRGPSPATYDLSLGIMLGPSGIETCNEADTVYQIMQRMTEKRFRHLPVVEGGRLIGIISIGDVV